MLRTALLTLALATLVVAPAYGHSSLVTLKGEVGPGFTIEVLKAGKDLKTIKKGTYKIKVEDKAMIHNFRLFGPGLNKKTGVPFVGDKTWTITLKPGRYTYQCDPHHLSGMRGHFKVTS
jgi:plastocyanin